MNEEQEKFYVIRTNCYGRRPHVNYTLTLASGNIARNMGQDTTTVWFDGTSLTIPCDTAIEMLSALEMYALQCFNTTAQHKANIAAMTTVDDVTAYDYTTGYPEKIELTL